MIKLDAYKEKLNKFNPIKVNGKVVQVLGYVIESIGPEASIGDMCLVYGIDKKPIKTEVVGFKEGRVLLMPIGEIQGIFPGSEVISTNKKFTVSVGNELLGRIIDGLGNPIDGKGPINTLEKYALHNKPPNPLSRKRIRNHMGTGIRAIDSLITCGKGQRIGVFSGSGVGKSVLLGRIARDSEADVNVIALIGERGREVREFIEKDLGEEGLKRSVVVVVTSDAPALLKIKGSFTACSIAEYFRDKGIDVMMMFDSITRFAMAQREIGLSIGEPPTTRGYTPSVFTLLPRLLERAGTSDKGSITGIYTVLVEQDDINDPIGDAVRAIIDGHIILSRALASKNHYPAIDILNSVSRIAKEVVSDEHYRCAGKMKDLLSAYNDAEDLINIGAYVSGSNKRIDDALKIIDRANNFLRQDLEETVGYENCVSELIEIMKKYVVLDKK